MKREEHLEYCKRCTKQKFDFKKGILCGLTNELADFDKECDDFEIDTLRIDAIKERKEAEKRSNLSFGFSPKQLDDIVFSDLTKKQAYIVALETAKKLKWNVGFISESGFTAYTRFSLSSWGEEVKISVGVGNISLKSECTGTQVFDWGKNRRNIRRFITVYNILKAELTQADLDQRYEELSKELVDEKNDFQNPILSRKEKVSGFFSLITPAKGYCVTPILININILIFVLMAIKGVHLLLPSHESLLLWGANFRPLTIDGEWWRIISSTFIHIGLVHLIMNMYALVYIGLLLEPYLGKSRFLGAYLLSGIAGSVSSLYWNELTISAGASGAIFGMYGVFLAMLSTNLIEKSARKSFLVSIGIFVAYNLLNGLKGGIDNAAHIGGLACGILIGFSYYPSFVKQKPLIKPITIGLLSIFISLGSIYVLLNTKSDVGKYEKDMESFVIFEHNALRVYRLPNWISDERLVEEIENNGITNWEECLRVLERIDTYELPKTLKHRNSILREYCKLRIQTYNTIVKAIVENTGDYEKDIANYNLEIERLISEITRK